MTDLLTEPIPAQSTRQAMWSCVRGFFLCDGLLLYRLSRGRHLRQIITWFVLITTAILSVTTYLTGIPQAAGFDVIRIVILSFVLLFPFTLLLFLTKRNNFRFFVLLMALSAITAAVSTFASIFFIGSPHVFSRDYMLAIDGIRVEPELGGFLCDLPDLIVRKERLSREYEATRQRGYQALLVAAGDRNEARLLSARGIDTLEPHEQQRLAWLVDSMNANAGIATRNADRSTQIRYDVDEIDIRSAQIIESFNNKYGDNKNISLWLNITSFIISILFIVNVVRSYDSKRILVMIVTAAGVTVGVSILIFSIVLLSTSLYRDVDVDYAVMLFGMDKLMGGERICSLEH